MLKFLARFFVVVVALFYSETGFGKKDTCEKDSQGNAQFLFSTNCYVCYEGCYCTGSGEETYSLDPDSKISTTQLQNFCKHITDVCPDTGYDISSTDLCGRQSSAKVYRCPDSFPNSNIGSDSIERCYFEAYGRRLYYKQVSCPKGKYLPIYNDTCMPCQIGYYCPGIQNIYPSSLQDQGSESCYDPNNPMVSCVTNSTGGTDRKNCKEWYRQNKGSHNSGAVPNTNHTACVFCNEGQYADEAMGVCYNCPDGYICEDGDLAACPAGYYCDGSEAIKCPAGSYSGGGYSWTLQPCSPSETGCGENGFREVNSSKKVPVRSCKLCPPGTYNDQTGQKYVQDCQLCPAGTANPNEGATSIDACKPCAPGQISGEGWATCSGCEVGQYMDKKDSICKYCPSGYAMKSNELEAGANISTVCEICPFGSYEKDHQCIECDANYGYYTDQLGQTRCKQCYGQTPKYEWNSDYTEKTRFIGCFKNCPSGYIVEGAGNSQYCAKLCSEPGYGWDKDAGACAPCPDGTYRSPNDTTTALCKPCPQDSDPTKPRKYSFGTGKEQCTTCPPGSCCVEAKDSNNNTVNGVATAYQCERGTYSEGGMKCDDSNKPGFCTACTGGMTTVKKGAKSSDECVPTVSMYCIGNSTVCFSWPTQINIYQNDIERQNVNLEE